MHDLIELVGLINKTKLKASSFWRSLIERDSQMELLYEGIAQGKIKSDDEARAYFKASREDPATLPKVKNRLKERLLDAIFLLDFKESNFSSRQKAFYECYKKWAGTMILMLKNARATGMEQMEQLLRHTIHFEFTELTLDILRVLRLQYSTVVGDMKRYEDVRDKLRHYEQIWIMENRAEQHYTDLMIHYANSKSAKTSQADQARAYHAELAPFMAQCQSFKLHLFGRLTEMMIYSTVNDYRNTARLCEEAIAFFDNKKFNSGLPLQVFYYNLIVAYLQLREFDKGQAIVEKSEKIFEEGSFNWFKVQELYFLLAMHTGRYQHAWDIYQRVTNHPKFKAAGQLPQVLEIWKIHQAYVYFLIQLGKIEATESGKFRMKKFMNDFKLFTQDKRGMNISILVAQILFALAEHDYGDTLSRIEAVEKYCVRYLKDKETYRSNCFIRMLLQLPRSSFHREAVARNTDKYHKMLLGRPLEVANQTHEVEIIPYEKLWEMIVEALEMKIIKVKKDPPVK